MMKTLKTFLLAIFVVAGLAAAAQPSFYDLTFQNDSVTTPYASQGTFVYMKSKRGDSGMPTTEEGDAIKSSEIVKIVLVFSEDSPDDIENRESYNQERWENLIATYPEYFQEKTKYKNVCQCTPDAANEDYKAVQGFYIYVKGAANATPPPSQPVVETKKEEPVAKNDPPKNDPPAPKKETPAPAKNEPVKTPPPSEPKKEPEVVANPPKPEEPAKQEEPQAPVAEVKTPPKKAKVSDDEEEVEAKPKGKGRPGYGTKPRKSKDPKACRPACYGYGDEDLVAFFKDNITLNKKQKRKAKKYQADLRIAIHFDGTIKKITLTGGDNGELNALINDALKTMNAWNPAVKGGTAIKSEVRMTIKFDKETKTFKPYNVMVNPKPNPKCKCASDSEIFGS